MSALPLEDFPLPLWSVGTPGNDRDWRTIRATDRQAAIDAWVWFEHGKDWCVGCPRRSGEDRVCACHPGVGVTLLEE